MAVDFSRYRRYLSKAGLRESRVAYLNPEIARAAITEARDLYEKQIGEPYPWEHLVPALCGLEKAYGVVEVRVLQEPSEW